LLDKGRLVDGMARAGMGMGYALVDDDEVERAMEKGNIAEVVRARFWIAIGEHRDESDEVGKGTGNG